MDGPVDDDGAGLARLQLAQKRRVADVQVADILDLQAQEVRGE